MTACVECRERGRTSVLLCDPCQREIVRTTAAMVKEAAKTTVTRPGPKHRRWPPKTLRAPQPTPVPDPEQMTLRGTT